MILTTAVAVVVVAGGYWMLGGPEGKSTVDFATETVTKGNVSNFITATGTIEPVTEVEVGTQVSGIIDKIYVDYNSVVTFLTISPSVSNERNVTVSIRWEISPMVFCISQKRIVPFAFSVTSTSIVHLSPNLLSTSRTGQASIR